MVEVIASMALIGTLLVLILKANADQSRNLAASRLKIKAVGAADRLVAAWISSNEGIPRQDNGNCDTAGLIWRVAPTSKPTSIPESEILELSILATLGEGNSNSPERRILKLSLLREVLNNEVSNEE